MREPRRRLKLLGLPTGLALWFALACSTPTTEREQHVVDDVRKGHFAQALERAQRMAEENPGDASTQRLLRDAQVAYVLDQGREQVFHGDLTKALELFERAHELAPESEVVANWIEKTRAQLATQWLDAAADRTGPEQLDEAEACYEKVLLYDADNIDARRGLAHVLLLKNYRAGQSKTYFDDGLSSFHELLLEQARREFQISQRYRVNEPADLRGKQVEKMMADERLAQARSLEAAGRYFAARNEYRLVLLIEPENEEGRAGLDRMDREARATSTLGKADMAIRRKKYEEASKSLDEAKLLTDAQADHVSLLESGIEEQRLEDMYRAATNLVRDYRYPEAVAAFDELLAIAPDFKDTRASKATIEEFISLTEEFYAKALAAPDDEQAEGFLRAIPIMWPDYKDVAQRLKDIEARKAAKEQGAEGAGADDEGETDEGADPEPKDAQDGR